MNITEPELISIKNSQQTYLVGDTLWVAMEIPLSMDTGEKTVNLSTFTDHATTARTIFQYYWVGNYEKPVTIPLSEKDIIVNAGEIKSDYGAIIILSKLEVDSFKSSFGVVLRESGTYTLRPPEFNLEDKLLEVVVGHDSYDSNKVSVFTSFAGDDGDRSPSTYTFTVK